MHVDILFGFTDLLSAVSGPTLTFLNSKFVSKLSKNELVAAERWYSHVSCITSNSVSPALKAISLIIRARREDCNKLFRHFNISNQLFCLNIYLPRAVFHACAEITFILIKDEEPLFTHRRKCSVF